jgi:hypothetical protein
MPHGLGRPFDWILGYEGNLDLAERHGFIMVSPLGYHPRGWYGSRGPGIPPGIPTDSSQPENLGDLSERDVVNVLRLGRDEVNVDGKRIHLSGHSMGGAGM